MSFIVNEENHDEFKMWQGLQGPYYTPYVSENGIISWTNNGGLQNPQDVNIKGDPGAGLEISGTADTVGDLPETAEEYSVYLVGTSEPYYGYIYADGEWKNIGEIGKGETGEGVPTGGTAGQVLKKQSATDYDSVWETENLGITGASVGDLVRISAVSGGKPTAFAKAPINAIKCNRNLLDNWYFVGGGSQLGYGVFPVNQRGQSIYINPELGYTIDRWKNPGNNVTFTVDSDGIQISISGHGWSLVQYLNPTGLSGKKVTISALFTSVSGTTGIGLIGNNDAILVADYNITSPGLHSATGTIPEGTTKLTFVFRTPTQSPDSATFKVAAVKLELGDNQTLAHQEGSAWVLNEIPNYSEQLYRCLDSHADSGDTYANKSPIDYLNNGLPSKFVMLTPETPALYLPNVCRCYGVVLDSTADRCGLYYLCTTGTGNAIVGKFTSSGPDVTGSTNKATFAVPSGAALTIMLYTPYQSTLNQIYVTT